MTQKCWICNNHPDGVDLLEHLEKEHVKLEFGVKQNDDKMS